MEKSLVIANLTKVRLDIYRMANENDIDQAEHLNHIDFIYGIGSSGLTDFEYLIAGKKIGDKVMIKPDSDEYQAFISHFKCDIKNVLNFSVAQDHLLVKISTISQASNREVVSAIAGTTPCSGSCECGCGC